MIDGDNQQQIAYEAITAAIYALAKENYDVVSCLEEQGAILHEGKSVDDAKELFEVQCDQLL